MKDLKLPYILIEEIKDHLSEIARELLADPTPDMELYLSPEKIERILIDGDWLDITKEHTSAHNNITHLCECKSGLVTNLHTGKLITRTYNIVEDGVRSNYGTKDAPIDNFHIMKNLMLKNIEEIYRNIKFILDCDENEFKRDCAKSALTKIIDIRNDLHKVIKDENKERLYVIKDKSIPDLVKYLGDFYKRVFSVDTRHGSERKADKALDLAIHLNTKKFVRVDKIIMALPPLAI